MTQSDDDSSITTRSGKHFHVRRAHVGDGPTIKAFFAHVTPADLRFRFLSGIREVSQAQVTMLECPSPNSDSFLVFTPDQSLMVATGMLACDADLQRGEVAIAIRADYKDQGIGWALLAHIARYAATIGLRTLEAIESRDNHAAIEVECDQGFIASEYPGDSTLMLVSRTLGHR